MGIEEKQVLIEKDVIETDVSVTASKPKTIRQIVCIFITIGILVDISIGLFENLKIDNKWSTYLTNTSITSPKNNTLSNESNIILTKLKSIDIQQQINDISLMYQKIFNSDVTEIRNKFNKFLFDNNNKNGDKCIILTPITYNHNDKDSRYDFNKTYYAYKSKLIYSNIHQYLFVIDSFNYLDYLDISRSEHWESLPLPKLKKIAEEINFNATSRGAYGHPAYRNMYDSKSQTFKHDITIRNHWNKVLSQIYWNQYVNCILQTDDDAFIGNYNLSIKYWLKWSNHGHDNSFLIVPYDITNGAAITFSNFAYILHDESVQFGSVKIESFLLKWFNMRFRPYHPNDQYAMFNTIQRYLLQNDHRFKQYLDSKPDKVIEIFKKCVEFCALCPICDGCTSMCWHKIAFKRPNIETIVNGEYNDYSIFWTPTIYLSWNYLMKYGNYDQYNFKIYPFALNLNWGSSEKKVFNDGEYREYSQKNQTEKKLLDNLAKKYLQFAFDKTYLLHYRHHKNNHVINTAVAKMKIFDLNL